MFEPTDLFTDPYAQSVYIHEATHYLQDKFGALRETCPEQWEIERNAYNTQFKYLAMKHYANKIVLPTAAQVCGPEDEKR